MLKEKAFKEKTISRNEKEGEMTLKPFRRKKNQKLASIIAMVVGGVLMVLTPVFKISESVSISGFVIGVIIALIGFVYFLDVQ